MQAVIANGGLVHGRCGSSPCIGHARLFEARFSFISERVTFICLGCSAQYRYYFANEFSEAYELFFNERGT